MSKVLNVQQIFLTKFDNLFWFEESIHFLKWLVVSKKGFPVPDNNQFDLSPGDCHVKSPGVEQDVPGLGISLLPRVSHITSGACVNDDLLVPTLILIYGSNLDHGKVTLEISLK